MKKEVHRHLDGENAAAELHGSDIDEVDAWARMVASFRTAAPKGETPPWLEQRIMAEIDALPEPGAFRRLLAWVVRPAPIRVSPLATGLVAAAFAWVILLPDAPSNGGSDSGTVPIVDGGADAIVYVQFVLDAPSATSVAVAGDFSEWAPSFALEDADGDGVWTGRVPVRPGVHSYMFLIDGTDWQTDPYAERYQDDGFGNRNAVLAVAASE